MTDHTTTDGHERMSNILRFEEEHHPFDLKIQGETVWDIFRYHLYNALLYAGKPNTDVQSKKHYSKIGTFIKGAFFFLTDYLTLKSKYDIIFINTTDRTYLVDEKNVNIYTYLTIKELTKQKKILLIDPYNSIHPNDYQCDILRTKFLDWIFALKLKLKLKLSKSLKKQTEQITQLQKALDQFFTCNLSLSQFLQTYFVKHLLISL